MTRDDRIISWGRADAWFFVDDLAAQLKASSELLMLMHEIAEDSYCESWSGSTSVALWRVVLDPSVQPEERDGWGYHRTERREAERLAELCREARCWWTWDEAAGDVAMVPLSEWAAEHGCPQWMPQEAPDDPTR